jgi:hypothetical protein
LTWRRKREELRQVHDATISKSISVLACLGHGGGNRPGRGTALRLRLPKVLL